MAGIAAALAGARDVLLLAPRQFWDGVQAREFTVDRFFSFTKFQLTYATVIATVEVVVGGSVKGPGSVN